MDLDESTLIAIGQRFDANEDGTSIGITSTEDVLFMANYVIGNPEAGISRDYMARIQTRDLLGA